MKQSVRARRMARHHKRLNQHPKLNLVSLMDIFTILVFFLLINSSDVEVLQSNKSIQLPESVAEKKPDNNLVVMVNNEAIVVGGRTLANTSDVLKNDDLLVSALTQELRYLAVKKPLVTEEEKKKGYSVTIMGDKDVPYILLKKIMSTCADADFRDISLAVNQQYVDEAAILEGAADA